eukprot:6209601-Pleurochrysis_carterae.AAC.2
MRQREDERRVHKPNMNSSQFFITTKASTPALGGATIPHFDHKHVVFGRVRCLVPWSFPLAFLATYSAALALDSLRRWLECICELWRPRQHCLSGHACARTHKSLHKHARTHTCGRGSSSDAI